MNTAKQIEYIKIENIIPNRYQPRMIFNEEELNELATSIKNYGIIQPLAVRKINDKYEIIAGERRYKAAIIAGLKEVPVIVNEVDDITSASLALIENLERKDLNAIEEARAYQNLMNLGNLKQEDLSQKIGKSQSSIANKLRLLKLPKEIQDSLMNNEISERHARSLLQLSDENKQKEVLNKIISQKLNVKATEDYIKSLLKQNQDSNQETIIDPLEGTNNNTVNLNDLNEAISLTNNSINNNVKFALNDLNIYDTNSNVFNDVEPLIEDRKEEIIDMNQEQNNMVNQPVAQPSEASNFNKPLENETVNMNFTVPQAPGMNQNNEASLQNPMPQSTPQPNVNTIQMPVMPEPIGASQTPTQQGPIPNAQIVLPNIPVEPVVPSPIPSFSSQSNNIEPTMTPPIMAQNNSMPNMSTNTQEPTIIDITNPITPQAPTMPSPKEEPLSAINIEPTPVVSPELQPPVEPISNGQSNNNLNDAISSIREVVSKIENSGKTITINEMDLEKEYQIIIKIEK